MPGLRDKTKASCQLVSLIILGWGSCVHASLAGKTFLHHVTYVEPPFLLELLESRYFSNSSKKCFFGGQTIRQFYKLAIYASANKSTIYCDIPYIKYKDYTKVMTIQNKR